MLRFSLALIAVIIFAGTAPAEWSHDPFENTRVPGYSGTATSPWSVTDGRGGVIVAWIGSQVSDDRLFVQRFDADGTKMWGQNGLTVVNPAGELGDLHMMSNDNGGAYVCWQEIGPTEPAVLYVQHVSYQGQVLWPAGGVRVCASSNAQDYPRLAPAGDGGLFCVWESGPNASSDIYAMRISPSGTRMWPADGARVCSATGAQYGSQVVGDGSGGIYVAWLDLRNGEGDIFAQRLDPQGDRSWVSNGIQVDLAGIHAYSPAAAVSTDGQLLVAWTDEYDVSIQKIAGDGTASWGVGGVVMSGEGIVYPAGLLAMPDGGAVLAFTRWQNGFGSILGQRFSTEGSPTWGNGDLVVLIGGDGGSYQDAKLARTTDGSIVVGGLEWDSQSLIAQRIDEDGHPYWLDGPGTYAANSVTGYTTSYVGADDGGSMAVFADGRDGRSDVYIQYLDGNGFCGDNRPTTTVVNDRPADQGGEVVVEWQSSWLDGMPAREITRYTLWFQELVAGRPVPPQPSADIEALAADLDLPRARVAGLLRDGWIFGLEVPAAELDAYAGFAPSLADSSDTGWPWFQYLVMAHGQESWLHWSAEPVMGYSVDNLEPGTPAGLVVAYEHPDETVLTWLPNQEPDLRGYRIHRGETEGFEVGPETLVDETIATEWTAPGTQGFYKIVAVDQHGNTSPPAAPEQVVGASEGNAPAALALHPCTPNPFNPVATIRFDVPAPGGHVRLDVLDLAGRRVTVLADAPYEAGQHVVRWEGTDDRGRDVGSGAYVCRFRLGGEVRTSKMVLNR